MKNYNLFHYIFSFINYLNNGNDILIHFISIHSTQLYSDTLCSVIHYQSKHNLILIVWPLLFIYFMLQIFI